MFSLYKVSFIVQSYFIVQDFGVYVRDIVIFVTAMPRVFVVAERYVHRVSTISREVGLASLA